MTAIEVLKNLVDTVTDTGGVYENPDGTHSPVGDPDWVDLADVYLAACAVLGIEPRVSENEEDSEPDPEREGQDRYIADSEKWDEEHADKGDES